MNNHMLKLMVTTVQVVALCHRFTESVTDERLCTGYNEYQVQGKIVLFEGQSFAGRGCTLVPDSDKTTIESRWSGWWVIVSPQFCVSITMESCTGSKLQAVNLGQDTWEVQVTPGCSYARFLEGSGN